MLGVDFVALAPDNPSVLDQVIDKAGHVGSPGAALRL
jgi:hypothetical protein